MTVKCNTMQHEMQHGKFGFSVKSIPPIYTVKLSSVINVKGEDFVSGNAYYGRAIRKSGIPYHKKIVNVKVHTRRVDGLDFPAVVVWPDGREYRIDRVHGSRYDDEMKALRYGVRIGNQNTFVWRREDGTWFVVKK